MTSKVPWTKENCYNLATIIVEDMDLTTLVTNLVESIAEGFDDDKDTFEQGLEKIGITSENQLVEIIVQMERECREGEFIGDVHFNK